MINANTKRHPHIGTLMVFGIKIPSFTMRRILTYVAEARPKTWATRRHFQVSEMKTLRIKNRQNAMRQNDECEYSRNMKHNGYSGLIKGKTTSVER